MRQHINDFIHDAFKAVPAGIGWVVGSVTADDIYKWLGILWFLLLIIDKLFGPIKWPWTKKKPDDPTQSQ